ncbi:MAG: hypothetical protein ACE5OR_08535 [bacterium]
MEISSAGASRAPLNIDGRLLGGRNAYRLVFSEGDFLPGLIIDR